jgi:hypothetical protein
MLPLAQPGALVMRAPSGHARLSRRLRMRLVQCIQLTRPGSVAFGGMRSVTVNR